MMPTIHLRSLVMLLALAVTVTAHAAITGTIVDRGGKTIAGATIRAYAAEGSAVRRARLVAGKVDRELVALARSARNGSFSIDVKGVSAVELSIDAPKFSRTMVETVEGEDLGAIVLDVRPEERLRVTSEGKPVPGAAVAWGLLVDRTDAAGEVPAGQGPYFVIHPDYAIAHSDGSALEIKLTPGVAVRGRIVNAAGPVQHVIISIDGWPLGESSSDGTFAVAHAPDNWRSITAIHGNEIGEAKRTASPSVEIKVSEGAVFTGTLRDATRGTPVAGARMTLAGPWGVSMVAVSDAGGSFTFAPLLIRNYRVSGLDAGYSIESAGIAVPATRVRDFVAQPFARVRGRVLDDEHKAVVGAIVSCNGDRARAAVTNNSGQFTLRFASSPTTPDVIVATKPEYIRGLSKAQVWQPGDTREDVVITLSHASLAH